MLINKRQLRKMVTEALRLRESAHDDIYGGAVGAPGAEDITRLTSEFVNAWIMHHVQQFEENPDAFEGFTTSDEWFAQLDRWRINMEREIAEMLEKYEDRLYGGRW